MDAKVSELEPALRARRSSMDEAPNMSEKAPAPQRSILGLLQERRGRFRQLYRRLRGAPVLGLGVRAAKGWTIAGLLASAVAMGVGLSVGTFSGRAVAAVGALVGAGAAVAVGMAVMRLRTKA